MDAGNNSIFTVDSVGTSDPNTMELAETVAAQSNDYVTIFNLTRSGWYDQDGSGDGNWECAVSTLYDDSKQESPLNVFENSLYPDEMCWAETGDGASQDAYGMSKVAFYVKVYAGDGSADGLIVSHPRVSGFNIYLRRYGTSTWYQQANVDITKGIKLANSEDYYGWGNGASDIASIGSFIGSGFLTEPLTIITYEDSAGTYYLVKGKKKYYNYK